jgi:hypothetical protein
LGVNLVPLSQANGLVKAMVQLWESRVALVLAKSVDIGMNIGIKGPIAQYAPVGEVEVVELRLAPYEVKLGGNYKGGNVENEMGKGKTVALGNHNGITVEENAGKWNKETMAKETSLGTRTRGLVGTRKVKIWTRMSREKRLLDSGRKIRGPCWKKHSAAQANLMQCGREPTNPWATLAP